MYLLLAYVLAYIHYFFLVHSFKRFPSYTVKDRHPKRVESVWVSDVSSHVTVTGILFFNTYNGCLFYVRHVYYVQTISESTERVNEQLRQMDE